MFAGSRIGGQARAPSKNSGKQEKRFPANNAWLIFASQQKPVACSTPYLMFLGWMAHVSRKMANTAYSAFRNAIAPFRIRDAICCVGGGRHPEQQPSDSNKRCTQPNGSQNRYTQSNSVHLCLQSVMWTVVSATSCRQHHNFGHRATARSVAFVCCSTIVNVWRRDRKLIQPQVLQQLYLTTQLQVQLRYDLHK